MNLDPKTDAFLHKKLPIDANEKILAIYRHHWFAYASTWLVTFFIIVCVFVGVLLMTGTPDSSLAQYRSTILAGAILFSTCVFLGGMIPAYLRSQEQLVLSEESILQVLQPTLFASKIDSLGLQHIADISVKQDFLGTMLGYGKVTIETPGEQDNYEFYMLPHPQDAARQITEAHENFDAALQSGKLSTTLGNQAPAAPMVNMEEYKDFLEFQQMRTMQTSQSTASPGTATEASSTNQTQPLGSPANAPLAPVSDDQQAYAENQTPPTNPPA